MFGGPIPLVGVLKIGVLNVGFKLSVSQVSGTVLGVGFLVTTSQPLLLFRCERSLSGFPPEGISACVAAHMVCLWEEGS